MEKERGRENKRMTERLRVGRGRKRQKKIEGRTAKKKEIKAEQKA